MAKVDQEPGEETMRAAKIGGEIPSFPSVTWVPQKDPGKPGKPGQRGENIELQTNRSQDRLSPRRRGASFWQAQRLFAGLPGIELYSSTYF
jgi:hypothetical protein